MSIKGVLLYPSVDQCPYLEGLSATSENLMIQEIESYDLENFLSMGFRHFGEFFFRPICTHCRSCIPLRVPVQHVKRKKSVSRLFKRNQGFTVTLETPVPSREMFNLYLHHKKRFKRLVTGPDSESYEQYEKSFFHPFIFNRVLTIRDGERLVAVSHLDITSNIMSAIYCYFDEAYAAYSPGKFAINMEIQIAKEMGFQWLYLGYYIKENRHTNYKVFYTPNQVMVDEHLWIDHMDADGKMLNPLPRPGFKLLADYKKA